jgi:DNA repair protein RadA/Sms
MGEIGLSGELRSVSQLERRLGEAAKLGFVRAIVPANGAPATAAGIEVLPARSLAEVVERALRPAGAEQQEQA